MQDGADAGAGGGADGRGTYLVFGGKTGWIGQQVMGIIASRGNTAVAAESRLEEREAVARELDAVKPDFVVNAAGLTGRPNVDWCEDHKEDVVRVNVVGTLSLVDLCNSRGIHVTNYATGCIYSYDDEHPIGGKGFTEEDPPNFSGSFYSYTKGMVEALLKPFPNVLTLRVRMPISDDLSPRNFITKITKYERVVNIPNSMTVLTELLPVSVTMTERKLKGVHNFTNPGAISHNQILDLYKKVSLCAGVNARVGTAKAGAPDTSCCASVSVSVSLCLCVWCVRSLALPCGLLCSTWTPHLSTPTSRRRSRTRSSRQSGPTTRWTRPSFCRRCPTLRSRTSTQRWWASWSGWLRTSRRQATSHHPTRTPSEVRNKELYIDPGRRLLPGFCESARVCVLRAWVGLWPLCCARACIGVCGQLGVVRYRVDDMLEAVATRGAAEPGGGELPTGRHRTLSLADRSRAVSFRSGVTRPAPASTATLRDVTQSYAEGSGYGSVSS